MFTDRVIAAVVVFYALELVWLWVIPAKPKDHPIPAWPAKMVELIPDMTRPDSFALL